LIEGIDQLRYEPSAAWALAVFQAGYSGDPVAREVVEWSARELGASAVAVIRQLDLENEPVEVIEAGSLFKGGTLYTDPLRQTIQATAANAIFIRLDVPPVIGGIVLAMQQIDLDAKLVRAQLNESTNQLIHQWGT
ncbi:MAG TPA: hypothetical protein VGJ22_12755, partial [Anaerolineales bacterium]